MTKSRNLRSIYNYVKKNFHINKATFTVENFPLIIDKKGIARSYLNSMKEVKEKDVKMINETKLTLFNPRHGNNEVGIWLTRSCTNKEIQAYLNIYNKQNSW